MLYNLRVITWLIRPCLMITTFMSSQNQIMDHNP